MDINNINISLEYKIRFTNQNKNNPSIFLLHGYGSNMNDLFSLHQFFPEDWTIVSLQAPFGTGFGGWAWAELDFNNLRELPKPEQSLSSRNKIISSISTIINELNLDQSKVHLIGFSQGASFTLFCGVTSVSYTHLTLPTICSV